MKKYIVLATIISGFLRGFPQIIEISDDQLKIKGFKTNSFNINSMSVKYDFGNTHIYNENEQIIIIGLNCKNIFNTLNNIINLNSHEGKH